MMNHDKADAKGYQRRPGKGWLRRHAVKDMFAFLMGKKQVIPFVALLLVVSGVVVLVALPLRAPRHLGRTWESWLGDLEQWDGDTNNPAFVAFREMGTNPIPLLLKVIQTRGSRLQRTIMR